MEQQLIAIVYIVIMSSLVNEMSTAVQARENIKRRTKEKSGGFQKNICDITDRDSKVHCYCENTREPRNATKAECWVFNGGIPPDDLIWQRFASQPTLQMLSFSVRVDGALHYIPTKALLYLQKLKYINIKYGDMVEIAAYALANLTNLREAILSQNQIEIMQQNAFALLPNITVINLEENMLLEIEKNSFVDVPKLQKIVFTKNNISIINDGAFIHTFNLLELDLNKNNIIQLNRHTFDGLANLKKLDLRKNRIYNLTEFTFAELWNLQELLLGKNEIKYISERAFDGLSQLHKLTLDGNKLTFLPSGLFEGVRGLSSLDLRFNELHAFTYDNIKPILDNLKPSSSSLLLEENNFVCDCRLIWMHSLRNETKSETTKDSLEVVTCKRNSASISALYDKIYDVELKTSIAKTNASAFVNRNTTNTKHIRNDDDDKKSVRVNVLKIQPEMLICPVKIEKTTELPYHNVDQIVQNVQNQIKTSRLHEVSNSCNKMYTLGIVPWTICLKFFIT